MRKFLHFFLCFFLFTVAITAQSLEENKRKYTNAKELLRLGNYELAMEAFRQVAGERPDNPYYQFASYYYILSASKAGRLSEALLMAEQMDAKYASWPKINEARFLGAEVAFKSRKFKEAIAFIGKIEKGIEKEQVKAMSLSHLSKINSLDSLKRLHKEYPDNPYIGEVLAGRIHLLPTNQQDLSLLKSLIREFKLDTATFSSSFQRQESKKKSLYKVALLFPFLINELNADNSNRSNYYAIDMYEGIKLGLESLSKQNVKINLFTYDTGKDNIKLNSLLEKDELKSMDLIIGPVTNTSVPAFDNFQVNTGLYAVNPLSANSKLTTSNPFTFLSEPSWELQAKNTANFIAQNYSPKKAAIFYGGTPKDSLLAINYRLAIQQKGAKVIAFNKVTKGNVSLLTRVLSDSSNRDLGNLFISSGEQSVAANFVSEVEKNGYKIPVVTSPQWLEYPFFNLDQFERLNFHFIYPNYLDYTKPAVEEFRTNYKKTVNIIPSTFSYIGFDLIHFFANSLNKYGTNFQKGIASTGYVPGVTLSGYDFSQGNINNFVPLVKFEGGVLKMVNVPIK